MFYDWGVFSAYRSHIPIISVGNITTGGTGKTPFVIFLANYFKKQGLKPLIITRGYKRQSREQIILKSNHEYSADYVGDEPFLMAKMCPDVDILINQNRVEAVRWAEASQKQYSIIILDDAFQHRAIGRDFNILLVSSLQNMKEYPPQGHLREPLKNIKRADWVVFTKTSPDHDLKQYIQKLSIPTSNAIEADSNSNAPNSVGVAFCGIGSPASFEQTLNNINCKAARNLVFKDHQKYTEKIIAEIEDALSAENSRSFITTHKDWVKLPKEFVKKYDGFYLDNNISINQNSDFWIELNRKLKTHQQKIN